MNKAWFTLDNMKVDTENFSKTLENGRDTINATVTIELKSLGKIKHLLNDKGELDEYAVLEEIGEFLHNKLT